MLYIHILDHDVRRRAEVARVIFDLSFHAELYDSFEELNDLQPDRGIILLSHHGAVGTLARLHDELNILPVVVYGSKPATREVVEAMRNGAVDFLDWPQGLESLAHALHRANLQGRSRMIELRNRRVAEDQVDKLSSRERQVLCGLIGGHKNKEIAARLGISPRTVEIHRANMMSKLDASSAAEAVRWAIRAGLDEEEAGCIL